MFGLKLNQVKQIMSISRKLEFDKSKLDMLLEAREAGRNDDEVIAELLGIPEGVDAKEYLNQRLTPKEYDVLHEVVEEWQCVPG